MSYELDHALTSCPDEDCWYVGDLEEFTDEELEDIDFCDGKKIDLKCPKCGHEWTGTVESRIEYIVD